VLPAIFVRGTADPRARVHGNDAASRAAGTFASIDGHPGRPPAVTFNARSHHARGAVRYAWVRRRPVGYGRAQRG
jgi:hypothetical protein